jgi:hypothetical protein
LLVETCFPLFTCNHCLLLSNSGFPLAAYPEEGAPHAACLNRAQGGQKALGCKSLRQQFVVAPNFVTKSFYWLNMCLSMSLGISVVVVESVLRTLSTTTTPDPKEPFIKEIM